MAGPLAGISVVELGVWVAAGQRRGSRGVGRRRRQDRTAGGRSERMFGRMLG